MKSWTVLREELLQDPKVRKEYERLKPRYELISQLISARTKKGLTQGELAKRMGTKQSAISRVEGGDSNPSIAFLEKLTQALGSKLIIQVR